MTRGDRWLVGLALVLTAVGLVMVYSAGSFHAFVRYGDSNHFLRQQLVRTVLGVGALLACSRLSLRRLEALAPWLLGGACVLLALVVAIGHMSNGATRWLKLGFMSVQPTDLGRLAAVVFLAWWLKRRPVAELGFWRGMAPPLVLLAVVAALILKQPNLSSAGLLLMTGFVMLFLSGAPLKFLGAPIAAGAAIVGVALATHPYMMTRVVTFLGFVSGAPLDHRGSGWQLDQSLIAIGSGGVLGRGLGGGLQKLLYLPEAHTDFIFAIIGEELGFVGAVTIVLLLAVLVWRGWRVGLRAPDLFGAYLALGITVFLAIQTLINLGAVTGLLPTKGLPLPFISFGGSSLLVTMLSTGILLNISQHCWSGAPEPRAERGAVPRDVVRARA